MKDVSVTRSAPEAEAEAEAEARTGPENAQVPHVRFNNILMEIEDASRALNLHLLLPHRNSMNTTAINDIPTMHSAPEPMPESMPEDARVDGRTFTNLFMEIDDVVGELTDDFPLLHIQKYNSDE
jgi:hypothetical protein